MSKKSKSAGKSKPSKKSKKKLFSKLSLKNSSKSSSKPAAVKLEKKIVLSLGGSVIFPEEINTHFLKEFRHFILDMSKQGYSFIIVTGGGKLCRKYQSAAKEIANPDTDNLDYLGIEVTKLNANFVRTLFGNAAYEKIILDPSKKLPDSASHSKIVLAGGWKPGCSTDKDAVLIAKSAGVKTIINMSNIEYVYEKDPQLHPNAEKIEKISWKNFLKLIGSKYMPGGNYPFDPVASRMAARFNQRVIVLNGTDISNLRSLLEGKSFKGTVIDG